MDVIRMNRKVGDFFTAYNAPFQGKVLSLKARGLLVTILALPNAWNFSFKGLVSICKESETAVRTAIKELEENGYCKIERTRTADGKLSDVVYTFYEEPYTENPQVENPQVENPHVGNQPQDNNTIKKILNKENTNFRINGGGVNLPFSSVRFLEVWNILIQQPKWRTKTKQALQMSANKLRDMGEQDAITSMEESIANNWQGLFPPRKQYTSRYPNNRPSSDNPFESARRNMEELDRRLGINPDWNNINPFESVPYGDNVDNQ